MWRKGADVVTLSNDFAGRKRKSYFLVTRGRAVAGIGACAASEKAAARRRSPGSTCTPRGKTVRWNRCGRLAERRASGRVTWDHCTIVRRRQRAYRTRKVVLQSNRSAVLDGAKVRQDENRPKDHRRSRLCSKLKHFAEVCTPVRVRPHADERTVTDCLERIAHGGPGGCRQRAVAGRHRGAIAAGWRAAGGIAGGETICAVAERRGTGEYPVSTEHNAGRTGQIGARVSDRQSQACGTGATIERRDCGCTRHPRE